MMNRLRLFVALLLLLGIGTAVLSAARWLSHRPRPNPQKQQASAADLRIAQLEEQKGMAEERLKIAQLQVRNAEAEVQQAQGKLAALDLRKKQAPERLGLELQFLGGRQGVYVANRDFETATAGDRAAEGLSLPSQIEAAGAAVINQTETALRMAQQVNHQLPQDEIQRSILEEELRVKEQTRKIRQQEVDICEAEIRQCERQIQLLQQQLSGPWAERNSKP
jgi:chromosome segregation ATPase